MRLETGIIRHHLTINPVEAPSAGGGHDAETMTPDVRASFRRGRCFFTLLLVPPDKPSTKKRRHQPALFFVGAMPARKAEAQKRRPRRNDARTSGVIVSAS